MTDVCFNTTDMSTITVGIFNPIIDHRRSLRKRMSALDRYIVLQDKDRIVFESDLLSYLQRFKQSTHIRLGRMAISIISMISIFSC